MTPVLTFFIGLAILVLEHMIDVGGAADVDTLARAVTGRLKTG